MIVVCGIILNRAGKILACQRGPGRDLAGKWEFPGGKQEVGESLEAALIRELREELAIDVCIQEPLTEVLWNYGKGELRLQPYVCLLHSGEAHPCEHAEIRWCSPGELLALDWAAADVPILHEFLLRTDLPKL